jgi:uncharacterized YigZ family protein
MLFSDHYLEIENDAQSVYKNKGSRFLTFVCKVHNEENIRQKLLQLRQLYPDASHHCYAWVIGHDKQHFRTNDDGEPANTAGKPIMRQIQRSDLTNILIVVVRYFGGTLLGVPGLIEAYGEAAAECLSQCTAVERTVYEKYELSCAFGIENEIYKMGRQYNTTIIVKDTENRFCAEIKIPLSKSEIFIKQLKLKYQIQYQYIGIA